MRVRAVTHLDQPLNLVLGAYLQRTNIHFQQTVNFGAGNVPGTAVTPELPRAFAATCRDLSPLGAGQPFFLRCTGTRRLDAGRISRRPGPTPDSSSNTPTEVTSHG